MFKASEKSTFKYWFAHWCAYQMTALNLKCWKFKYLFHDIEKPWLLLIWRKYEKVRNWHRYHNKHHLFYKNVNNIDWEAAIIDWECSRFTKEDAPKTAREKYNEYVQKYNEGEHIGNWKILEKYKNEEGNYEFSLSPNPLKEIEIFNQLVKKDEILMELMKKNVPIILDRLGL